MKPTLPHNRYFTWRKSERDDSRFVVKHVKHLVSTDFHRDLDSELEDLCCLVFLRDWVCSTCLQQCPSTKMFFWARMIRLFVFFLDSALLDSCVAKVLVRREK